MTKLQTLAIAAIVAVPAAALAQSPTYAEVPATSYTETVPATSYAETIIIYDASRYQSFVARERGALQSGGVNLADIRLADDVAMAMAGDPVLRGASVTVSANNGSVSISGQANHEQSEHARQIARSVTGGQASGELANNGG